MNDFQTIDSTNLEGVTGGALPIKPIINGAKEVVKYGEKAYEAVKPIAKKVWDGVNVVGTVGAAGEAIHQGWNYLFGKKQAPKGGTDRAGELQTLPNEELETVAGAGWLGAAARVGGRVGTKFLPVVGWASDAYSAYEAYGAYHDARAQGEGVGSSMWQGAKAFVVGR